MSERIEERLVQYIQQAVAMEESIGESLLSMVETTEDPELRARLERHVGETEEQAGRLRRRLEAHGAEASLVRELGAAFGAALKGVVDLVRGDADARNARDAFATEHLEIASYELLERIATAAGDPETAAVARANRAEEEAMAADVAASWDRVARVALRQ